MGRFIGEDLNKRQIAALQAVAHACGGAQFASIDNVKKIPDNHRDCRALEEATDAEWETLLGELDAQCLIERKIIKEKPHVGLTSDGRRCNLIDAWD